MTDFPNGNAPDGGKFVDKNKTAGKTDNQDDRQKCGKNHQDRRQSTVKATEKGVKTAKATSKTAIRPPSRPQRRRRKRQKCPPKPPRKSPQRRQHILYPCQCGGGSLHAADTEVCEAVRNPRICGAYQGGDDAGIWRQRQRPDAGGEGELQQEILP